MLNAKQKVSGVVPLFALAALAVFSMLVPFPSAALTVDASMGHTAFSPPQQYPEKPPADPFEARLIPPG